MPPGVTNAMAKRVACHLSNDNQKCVLLQPLKKVNTKNCNLESRFIIILFLFISLEIQNHTTLSTQFTAHACLRLRRVIVVFGPLLLKGFLFFFKPVFVTKVYFWAQTRRLVASTWRFFLICVYVCDEVKVVFLFQFQHVPRHFFLQFKANDYSRKQNKTKKQRPGLMSF